MTSKASGGGAGGVIFEGRFRFSSFNLSSFLARQVYHSNEHTSGGAAPRWDHSDISDRFSSDNIRDYSLESEGREM